MGVGSGHQRPRIAWSELDVDRSLRRRGRGGGAPADHLIRPLGLASWKRWVAVGVLATLATTCAFLLVLFWFER